MSETMQYTKNQILYNLNELYLACNELKTEELPERIQNSPLTGRLASLLVKHTLVDVADNFGITEDELKSYKPNKDNKQ